MFTTATVPAPSVPAIGSLVGFRRALSQVVRADADGVTLVTRRGAARAVSTVHTAAEAARMLPVYPAGSAEARRHAEAVALLRGEGLTTSAAAALAESHALLREAGLA